MNERLQSADNLLLKIPKKKPFLQWTIIQRLRNEQIIIIINDFSSFFLKIKSKIPIQFFAFHWKLKLISMLCLYMAAAAYSISFHILTIYTQLLFVFSSFISIYGLFDIDERRRMN